MHQKFAPYLRAVVLSVCLLFAANAVQAQQVKTIKPKMAISDCDFVAQLLNTIEITGSEVDAFLEVRGVFVKELEGAVKDKKLTTDLVTVELTVPQAQNLVTLMQRAKLSGGGAEKFKELVTMIINAAKAEIGEGTGKVK